MNELSFALCFDEMPVVLVEADAPVSALTELVRDNPGFAVLSFPAPLVRCEAHGIQQVIESGCNPGFTGASIYWDKLACGCCDVDDSADTLEAVR